MGYSYDMSNRLCCDNCGQSGGVRKRTCPQKVLIESHRSSTRHEIRYCYPAALCAECYSELRSTLHADCKKGAAKSQAERDATQARLENGEHLLISARGAWADDVPDGYVMATFAANHYEDHQERLVPADFYDVVRRNNMSMEQLTDTLQVTS